MHLPAFEGLRDWLRLEQRIRQSRGICASNGTSGLRGHGQVHEAAGSDATDNETRNGCHYGV